MPEIVLSVGEFIELVNQTLEFAYANVVVEGEITEFSIRQDKWVHFTMKDAEASVNCFMTTYGLKTPLQDGMKIRVTGLPKVTTWGRFSLNVRSYELAGEGTLKQAYELLKAKLEAEGLFDQARKRSLPSYPKRIGLITSAQSEAFKDFTKIINERWGGVSVEVANVQVQGLPAPDQIVNAVEYFNTQATPPDVLVIVRGGGSLEDLQAFNSEPVARAIAGSRTPTIVGVGHEGDVSLADLVADLRAATPTDAARKVVPNKQEVISSIKYLQDSIYNLQTQLLSKKQAQVEQMSNQVERFLSVPIDYLTRLKQRLTYALTRSEQAMAQDVHLLEQFKQGLVSSARLVLQSQSQSVGALVRSLKNLDPERVLARGYAIARKNGRVIKAASDVEIGDRLMLQLAKDQLTTEVKDV